MREYVVTCCSTADMSRTFMETNEVPFAMFHYQLDGKEYADDLYSSISPEVFYKMIGERIFFHPVADGETREIFGYQVQFFDIRSTKAKQVGFTLRLMNGKKFTFVGDEPYQEHEKEYAEDADWLLHEAFCVYGERNIFKPYEKHHSTVKDACELAEHLKIPNLVLWHTEDKNMLHRQEKYMKEGKQYYTGTLYIPEDLDVLKL